MGSSKYAYFRPASLGGDRAYMAKWPKQIVPPPPTKILDHPPPPKKVDPIYTNLYLKVLT
jgi:hypothetical protein